MGSRACICFIYIYHIMYMQICIYVGRAGVYEKQIATYLV